MYFRGLEKLNDATEKKNFKRTFQSLKMVHKTKWKSFWPPKNHFWSLKMVHTCMRRSPFESFFWSDKFSFYFL